IMTTHLGWPAVWWYGEIPIGVEAVAKGRLPDGGVMLEVAPEDRNPGCIPGQLRDALKGYRRVLVYIGFPDFADGFPERLLHRLEELGKPTAYGRFAELGQAEVVELDPPDAGERMHDETRSPGAYAGCIGVQPAVAQ